MVQKCNPPLNSHNMGMHPALFQWAQTGTSHPFVDSIHPYSSIPIDTHRIPHPHAIQLRTTHPSSKKSSSPLTVGRRPFLFSRGTPWRIHQLLLQSAESGGRDYFFEKEGVICQSEALLSQSTTHTTDNREESLFQRVRGTDWSL